MAANLSITPKSITITADAQTKVYGEADPTLTYQITSGSLETGDTLTGSLARVLGEEVGEYAINSTLENSNYEITFVTTNLSITPKSITITADTKTKVYGESDPVLTYQITSGSLETGDVLTGSLSRDSGEAVGSYSISSTLANSNYNITFISANFSIELREIAVNADAKTKDYGDVDPELTYQITSGTLVNGDLFTGALTREPGEEVGIYHIYEGTLQLSDNYQLIYTGADLTITNATASIGDIFVENAIRIYPNPVLKTLFIETNSNLILREVLIYNLLGKVVQKEKNVTESISLKAFPKGIYLLKIITNQGIGVKKILKE